MQARGRRGAVATLVGVLGAGAIGAGAAEAKIVSYPRKARATPLARAMTRHHKLVRRAVFSAVPPAATPAAVSTTPLAGFPTEGKSYAMLSTGNARFADAPNDRPDTGTTSGGPSIRGARDVTIMRVDLRVPRGHNCLSFDFRFLSEEYPEFVGDLFNDAFVAELGGSNWSATSKQDPTVSSPLNFATDAHGSPIRINTTGLTGMSAAEAKGTTYDGATRILRASSPVKPGRRRLYLSIFDQGDRIYDSAVFLDHLRTGHAKKCRTGVRLSR
ncbi:MAG TPA: choice-of-anchor L domain-containing protein [Baekduia sp.]|nr:choice-of-anchor L domain-containing protein [Baekduia sp.]